MKNIIAILITTLIASCDSKVYNPTEFFLINNADTSIDVTASALVRYSEGYKEETIHDLIQSGDTVSMRKINATDSVDISDVFTKIEISSGSDVLKIDPMKKEYWKVSKDPSGNVKFTLVLDNSSF